MSYELALELREAGFPQSTHEPGLYYIDPDTAVVVYPELNPASSDAVRVPTLSQLIKACGSNISAIIRSEKGWEADGEAGDSVIEAVSRRWISLYGRAPSSEIAPRATPPLGEPGRRDRMAAVGRLRGEAPRTTHTARRRRPLGPASATGK